MKESTASFVLRKRTRQYAALYAAKARTLAGWSPPLPGQRLIFAISNGRSGTNMLANVFGAFADTAALHEPRPDFRHLRSLAAKNPALARDWLRYVKLPDIAATPGTIYVDTSHMFGKGFLEPTLDLGVLFDLVLLQRPAREIASSMVRLPSIPGESLWARSFYVAPDEPNMLPIDPTGLSPYQICYWHALETERRQAVYREMLTARGRRAVTFATHDLSDEAAVVRMFEALGLDMDRLDRARLTEKLSQRVNLKAHEKTAATLDPAKLDEEEAAVLERLPAEPANTPQPTLG